MEKKEDCVEESPKRVKGSAKDNRSRVLSRIHNNESVNMLKKLQPVLSTEDGKCSRNENYGPSYVESHNKNRNNAERKSRFHLRTNKNKKPEYNSICQIDEKDTTKTDVEKSTIKKNTRKSIPKLNNTLLQSKSPTCLPSTSSELSNSCAKKTEVEQTKTSLKESTDSNTSIQPNCEPSNQNALRTLYPHVGLNFFPESNKATPILINNKRKQPETTVSSEKLSKRKFKVGSLVVDRFYHDTKINTPANSESLPLLTCPNSPELKKRKSENSKRESQYPQPIKGKTYPDAVFRPPLANPGTMVGFTPAGQRHEVDLNFERPSWFSSEYARVQFDDATKINVSRMMHDMESGSFLPADLDADIESKHKADQELFKKQTTELFDKLLTNSDIDDPPLNTENIADLEEIKSKLVTEDKLVELIQFVMLRHHDFPLLVSEKLKVALNWKITPLMFKKNPVFLECIEELSESSVYLEVKQQAQALLNKIKGLFNVPETQTFDEYFESQVDILKDATEHLNLLELMVLTEEPNRTPSDGSSNEPNETATSDPSPQPSEEDEASGPEDEASESEEEATGSEEEASGSEEEMEWVPVENNDVWVDINETGDYSERYITQLDETIPDEDEDDNYSIPEMTIGTDSATRDSEDVNSEESNFEYEFFNEEYMVVDTINGMLIHGYPGYTKIDFFEYI